MAKIEPKLSEYEFNALVNEWVEEKKVRPSRMNRHLTYKLYNQLFNQNQRDVNACTCLDRDTDLKVTRQLEKQLKLDPLPIQPSFKIDMSSMMGSDEAEDLVIFDEEVITPKPKRKRTPKTITKDGASLTKNNK
jgi:hypothetical protein